MNKIGSNTRAWYPDVYNVNICSQGFGFPSFCANFSDATVASQYISLCVADPVSGQQNYRGGGKKKQ